MKYLLVLLIAVLCSAFAPGDEQDVYLRALLTVCGASSLEELSEADLEHFESLKDHPLPLNSCSQMRLRESGLFTAFQIASLQDYMSRSGDILSFQELALVDGFSEEQVQALRFFLNLDSPGSSGRRNRRLDGEACVRVLGRKESGSDAAFSRSARFSLEKESAFRACVAASNSYSEPWWPPELSTWSATVYGRSSKLVLGDMNARFGQGLLLWTGMSMSGFSSTSAFVKNPSGIVGGSSFAQSGRLRGLGAELSRGHFNLSSLYSPGQEAAAANLNCSLHSGQIGLSALRSDRDAGLSADFRSSFGGWVLFGEGAWELSSNSGAALLGISRSPAYGYRYSLISRYYSPHYKGAKAGAVRSSTKTSDEYGVAAGVHLPFCETTLDWCAHPSKGTRQLKALAVFSKPFALSSDVCLTPSLRISERFRPAQTLPYRTDLRTDVDITAFGWMAHFRANALWCRGVAWLWYAEAGRKGHDWSIYLRTGVFKVDNWDDRIYVYERDAPGLFNVPSYYGRGWNASFVLSWKKAHLRMSTVQYPWILKPCKYELRFQWLIPFE